MCPIRDASHAKTVLGKQTPLLRATFPALTARQSWSVVGVAIPISGHGQSRTLMSVCSQLPGRIAQGIDGQT
jgi:hypothetical protein